MTRRPAPRVAGHFGLTADWRLEGWCWFPDRPADRAAIDITVNAVTVQSCIASQLNEALRESRIGDGRYGFSLSIPPEAVGDAVLEARERRSGLVLGRVTFGTGADLARDARLDRLERQIADCLATLTAPLTRQDTIANAVAAFAVHFPGRRSRPTDLPAPAPPPIAPTLSLIVLAAAWPDTSAALRHAKALLPDAEILLITADPATIVASGLIAGVQVIPAAGTTAHSLNDALLHARGKHLAVVDAPRAFLAVGIEGHLHDAAPALLGSGAATHLTGEATHWLPAARPNGIAAILHRRDLLDVGGFDTAPDGGVDWSSLAAKLAALGRPVEASPNRWTRFS